MNVGFRLELCNSDRAIAVEINPRSSKIEDHTIANTSSSPLFAKYEKGVIRGGSCGCGHLNQFLAAVGDGAQTSYTELCDPGKDRFSPRLVADKSEQMAQSIEKGITWTMIKYAVEEQYPEFPAIIQRGLNVEHHVGEGAHEII